MYNLNYFSENFFTKSVNKSQVESLPLQRQTQSNWAELHNLRSGKL